VPHLGMGELIVLLFIVLLVFGASRLPQIGEGMGKAIKGLKRGLASEDDIDVTPTGPDKRVSADHGNGPVEPSRSVSDADVVEKKT